MAERKATLRVGIEGEQDYKQAIAELNRDNHVLNSEMKKLQEQFKGSEDSMEAMKAKSELLERQLLQQKDKVQTLREALKNAAASFGEADKRTQSWQIQLNNAEAQQAKLEHALEETNQQIEAQGDATEEATAEMAGFGDSIDEIAGKLGIHLPDSVKEALNGMEGFSVGTVAAMAAAAGAIAGVYEAVKALHEMTLKAAADVDELITKSMTSGVSTETLQQWEYAANLIDVSVDTMTGSLTKLTNSMYDAENGNAKLAATFEALGVSVTDTATGQLRPAEEVFYDVIDALSGVENQTERDAVAMDLMGKSAQELNPLIIQGSQTLRDLADEAKKTGYVLDESQIKKLGEVDDAYQKYQLQIETTEKLLAVEFAPASKSAMETFSNAVEKAGKALVDSGLVEHIGSCVQSVLALVDAGVNLVDALPSWLDPIENVSRQFEGLAYVLAAVADAIDVVGGILPWNWGSGQLTTALGWNIDQGQLSHVQQVKYGSGYSYNAAGDYNWRGGLTWVGESGPELVSLPRGSQIYSNQESRQLVAQGGGTDVSRIESMLARGIAMMERIEGDLADFEAVRRMA